MQWNWRTVAAAALLAAVGSIESQDRISRDESAVVQAFLEQEKQVWDLENRLLREAMDAIVNDRSGARGELALRRVIRQGRSRQTLSQVRNFISDCLQRETRDLLREIADANSMKPEDVYADYLTLEATIDFSLMASAYNTVNGSNFDKFPNDARRLLRNLVEPLSRPPKPSSEIEVGRIRNNRLSVVVFGCEIIEEVTRVDFDRRGATLVWKSNYSFLRDLKDRKDPMETREERLEFADGHWLVSYRAELEDFLDNGGRSEWALKVRDLVNVEGYLSRKDPLDESKTRRTRYIYDPEGSDESSSRFVGQRERDDDRPRRD